MKRLTEQECLEIGGHCWNYSNSNEVTDEFGIPTETLGMDFSGVGRSRTCRHCRKTEQEIPAVWR